MNKRDHFTKENLRPIGRTRRLVQPPPMLPSTKTLLTAVAGQKEKELRSRGVGSPRSRRLNGLGQKEAGRRADQPVNITCQLCENDSPEVTSPKPRSLG